MKSIRRVSHAPGESGRNEAQAVPLPGVILVVALLVGAGGCAQDGAKRGATAAPPVSEGFVTAADGTRLFCRRVGDGPQAVILPADLFLYPDFGRLAEGRTLYFYDMRNRGQSDSVAADRENSIQQDVADLEAVRAHYELDHVDLVGFSYLGMMVALYAMEHPEHVRRIVQLGPVPMRFGTSYPEGLGPADYTAAMDSDAVAELHRLQAEGFATNHPAEYCEREWAVTRFTLVGDPAHVDRLHDAPCDMPNEWPAKLSRHFARFFASVQNLDTPKTRIAEIRSPVLVVHGTMDRNAAYGSGREWAMTLPDARLVTVEGAAHCSWVDDPERVFGAIEAFLGGEWPAAAERVTTLERSS